MSTGFFPALLAMLLCGLLPHDKAIYVGTAIGIVASTLAFCRLQKIVPLLLYTTTGVLLLLSLEHLALRCTCPDYLHRFTIEVCTLVPPLVIILNRKQLLKRCRPKRPLSNGQLYTQSMEATIVSSRIALIIGGIHFVATLCAILSGTSNYGTAGKILFHAGPPVALLLCILLNQLSIRYFNRLMERSIFFPVITPQGDVVGKCLAEEALQKKREYINPVIRIAIVYRNMFYLMPRPSHTLFEQGKTDLPVEEYLLYGETLQQGAERMLDNLLPPAIKGNLRFNVAYPFENEKSNRMVYLFLLELEEETTLGKNLSGKGGKFWTLRQIEHNLHKEFFATPLEREYEYLKAVTYTKEKYKES